MYLHGEVFGVWVWVWVDEQEEGAFVVLEHFPVDSHVRFLYFDPHRVPPQHLAQRVHFGVELFLLVNLRFPDLKKGADKKISKRT